jgi:aminoglycoside/choline kinase family phosphotransferase
VRAPRCWYVDHDPESDAFVLLLEDLSPAVQGDQLAGCAVDQAAVAVEELPRLHAPRWDDPKLADIPWLNRGGDDSAAFTAQLIGSLYPGFRERYADRLDADVLEMGDRFLPQLLPYMTGRSGPKTVAHGDYRLDNLLFGTEAGGYPVAVVDWQTVTYGPGISDLSYFLGAGLVTEDRRAHEEALVRSYHEGLLASGVGGLSWDDCWTWYRYYTFAGFLMAVAASMLVVQTERGDDMFVTMAQRHGRHVLDLEAERLVPG